jgi:hypothetical protein
VASVPLHSPATPAHMAPITLTNGAANTVNISETLLYGNGFADSGAGDALAFNADKTVTLGNVVPAGTFVVDSTPKGDPYGKFRYAIDYTGHGTCPPTFTSFSFTTTDGSTVTVQDFVANAAGYFFAGGLSDTAY